MQEGASKSVRDFLQMIAMKLVYFAANDNDKDEHEKLRAKLSKFIDGNIEEYNEKQKSLRQMQLRAEAEEEIRESQHETGEYDLLACPGCGGEADQGYDRCLPPAPYYCSKCDPPSKSKERGDEG